MDDYNTQKEPLILKEYGRNVQKLVNYLQQIEDRDKRNHTAKALVELMKQINPTVKDGNEESQKLWDDLFIMSDFKLDIDSPFPVPKKELLYKKPDRLNYHTKDITYKHYGLNIQLMIEKAINMEDKEEKEAAVIYIGRLMKSFASLWNKENLDDDTILKNIKYMSKSLLDLDMEKVQNKNLFEHLVKEKPRKSNTNHHQRGGGGKRPRRKRN
jgi:hypothetical protein